MVGERKGKKGNATMGGFCGQARLHFTYTIATPLPVPPTTTPLMCWPAVSPQGILRRGAPLAV